MASLPVVSGQEAVRAFQKGGWVIARQRGSHIIMTKIGSITALSVPNHSSLKRGLLRSLIRQAGITVDQFVGLLEG